MDLYQVDQARLVQILAVNNPSGIYLSSSAQVLVAQAVSAHNSCPISLNYTTDATFSANLVLGSNSGSCTLVGAVNPGLTSGCQLAGDSDASLRAGIALTGTLLAQLRSDDPVNPADLDGTADYLAIIGAGLFANPYRSWGRDGLGAFLGAEYQGNCESGPCRIWDWRLSALDQVLRGRSGDGLERVVGGARTLARGVGVQIARSPRTGSAGSAGGANKQRRSQYNPACRAHAQPEVPPAAGGRHNAASAINERRTAPQQERQTPCQEERQ